MPRLVEEPTQKCMCVEYTKCGSSFVAIGNTIRDRPTSAIACSSITMPSVWEYTEHYCYFRARPDSPPRN